MVQARARSAPASALRWMELHETADLQPTGRLRCWIWPRIRTANFRWPRSAQSMTSQSPSREVMHVLNRADLVRAVRGAGGGTTSGTTTNDPARCDRVFEDLAPITLTIAAGPTAEERASRGLRRNRWSSYARIDNHRHHAGADRQNVENRLRAAAKRDRSAVSIESARRRAARRSGNRRPRPRRLRRAGETPRDL